MYPRDEFYSLEWRVIAIFWGRELFYSFNRQYFANEARNMTIVHTVVK